MRLAAVIPARHAAQRLPGKPLADLLGKPMVVRVAEAASRARNVDVVVVATDDARIFDAVRAAGLQACMTSPACRNGTERVAEAARTLDADAFVNVQGDEPLLDPGAVEALAAALRDGAPYATLARPLQAHEAAEPSVVKVVLDHAGRALYFSRSLIPFPRTGGAVAPLAHVGLYGYSRAFLQTLAALPETDLERAEGLEQLRALFFGHALHVRVGDWNMRAVDTPEDLEAVRQILRARLNETDRRIA